MKKKKVILVRDRYKERNLIERLDRSFLKRDGSVWASEREDAIYDVMYHLLPELEKQVDIYMPNAVKAMVQSINTAESTGRFGKRIGLAGDFI